MTADLWPCWRCGDPGIRNLGTQGYCGDHLFDLLESFSPDVWRPNGIGIPVGRARPDIEPGFVDLKCNDCRATWTGLPFASCQWCIRRRRFGLLEAPDPEPEHTLEARLAVWADKLRDGVTHSLITSAEAEQAVRKAVPRAA